MTLFGLGTAAGRFRKHPNGLWEWSTRLYNEDPPYPSTQFQYPLRHPARGYGVQLEPQLSLGEGRVPPWTKPHCRATETQLSIQTHKNNLDFPISFTSMFWTVGGGGRTRREHAKSTQRSPTLKILTISKWNSNERRYWFLSSEELNVSIFPIAAQLLPWEWCQKGHRPLAALALAGNVRAWCHYY